VNRPPGVNGAVETGVVVAALTLPIVPFGTAQIHSPNQ
jgi:hypothetical protein